MRPKYTFRHRPFLYRDESSTFPYPLSSLRTNHPRKRPQYEIRFLLVILGLRKAGATRMDGNPDELHQTPKDRKAWLFEDQTSKYPAALLTLQVGYQCERLAGSSSCAEVPLYYA